jgi:hypothetical protein
MAFVTVKGTIEKFHNTGYGFTLLETYKTREGVEASKKWQVFPDDITHGHVPSDVVTVNGTVTAKVYSFTNEEGVEVHVATMTVNNAKFNAPKTEDVASAVQSIGGTVKTEMPF